jgi:hypothetical protein
MRLKRRKEGRKRETKIGRIRRKGGWKEGRQMQAE